MLAAKGTKRDIGDPRRDEKRKYDGTRASIIEDGDRVVMRGRSLINGYAPNCPEIVAEIQQLPADRSVESKPQWNSTRPKTPSVS